MPDSGASAGPLSDLCNSNQLLKKGAWKEKKKKTKAKIIIRCKKKIKPNLPKPESQLGKSSGVKPRRKHSGTRWCTCSSSATHPCGVGYLCGGSESAGCGRAAGDAAEGRSPWLGRTRLPLAPRANLSQSGWPGLILSACLPPSFPPLPLSHRDPVQGGAIVTDTIPVLKPLRFVNKTSSMARARSLLNIYEAFLRGGDYCKLQFPFAMCPPPMHPLV